VLKSILTRKAFYMLFASLSRVPTSATSKVLRLKEQNMF
jgi:hypothetical protein